MGKHKVLPNNAFYAKRIEIFSSSTSEIRTNQILIFCFIWFNVLRLFIPHTYTQNSLHFNSSFSPLALLPLYIYLPITLHNISCQIHRQKMMWFTFNLSTIYLHNFNIVVLSNPNPYELATTKEGGIAFYIEWQRQ